MCDEIESSDAEASTTQDALSSYCAKLSKLSSSLNESTYVYLLSMKRIHRNVFFQ